MVPVARKSLYTATSYYFSDFPEHGVLFIAEDNFSIKEFYSELQAPTKDSADKAFRTIITSISQFTLTKKNEKLVSFANNVRTANFGVSFIMFYILQCAKETSKVLESPEAYDLWTITMDNRSISKRIYSRALKENELANEPSKAKKKIKITEEETDSQSSQSSILSSLSLESSASDSRSSQSSTTTSKLWPNWNTFVKLFISSSYEDLDVNEYR